MAAHVAVCTCLGERRGTYGRRSASLGFGIWLLQLIFSRSFTPAVLGCAPPPFQGIALLRDALEACAYWITVSIASPGYWKHVCARSISTDVGRTSHHHLEPRAASTPRRAVFIICYRALDGPDLRSLIMCIITPSSFPLACIVTHPLLSSPSRILSIVSSLHITSSHSRISLEP